MPSTLISEHGELNVTQSITRVEQLIIIANANRRTHIRVTGAAPDERDVLVAVRHIVTVVGT